MTYAQYACPKVDELRLSVDLVVDGADEVPAVVDALGLDLATFDIIGQRFVSA